MKNSILSLFVAIAAVMAITGCGSEPSVELSPEMTEFVGMIKGTAEDVTAALEKFGATEEIKEHDLTMYNLKDPKVKSKEGDCYTVEFTSGMITIVADICWADGKINSLTEK